MSKQNSAILNIASVMSAFFAMGFIDIISIATNYVKVDFNLTDTTVGILSFMVFFWFLVLSVPSSMLVNKIGVRQTAMLSITITSIALSLPLFSYSLAMLVGMFSLLGVGITIAQVSLSPLVANIVAPAKLASALTFGQFIKAIASFLLPIIAAYASLSLGSWTYILPIIILTSLLSIGMLAISPIHESAGQSQPLSAKATLTLLSHPIILLSFIAIICHVGIDVGINIASPKIMMERVGMPLQEATYSNSLYFLLRLIGCLIGAAILAQFSNRKFFIISLCIIALGFIGLYTAHTTLLLYISIGLIGIGNSNIFSIIVSRVMLYMPQSKNEISGLMIMGLFGGAIFPLLMGIASDSVGSQTGGIAALSIAVVYLLVWGISLKAETGKR